MGVFSAKKLHIETPQSRSDRSTGENCRNQSRQWRATRTMLLYSAALAILGQAAESIDRGALTLTQQNPGAKPAYKNPILYSSLVLLAVFLYVVWIFFSRWQESREFQHRARDEKSQQQLAHDREAIEQFGGKELAIQSFYASAGEIHRGEKLQLCYGVANAKTVKLEPQDNPVWPSYSRCVEVSPSKSTTYTLTIQDAAGNTKTESIDVKVR